MNKKILVGSIIVILVAVGLYAVLAKGGILAKPQKVYHVGILNALGFFDATVDGFKSKMTELGYVEGVNIIYDVQKGAAPVGNQAILNTFVQNKVDLIFALPTEATIEAKEVTKGTGIPVLFAGAGLEGNSIVESISRPGGNLTGVRFPVTELGARRLEILHALAPKAKRILIPFLKDYPTVAPGIAAVMPKAEALGLIIIEKPLSAPDELAAYLKELDTKKDVGFDAIMLIAEPVSTIPAFLDQLHVFADTHGIPVGGGVTLLADKEYGPLFSLNPSVFEFGQLAAPLADQIFKGVDPGTIPVVTPESTLEINYKATTKLGLTVPEYLLSIANKIIH